ncbi:S8 family serine peptidase [Sutcliffiella horikoshii]|uniref:S8 family serine peptidase n=1 Tax=Sutcliffiella horikoshii TaxID=79883 RepID=UPI003CE9D1C6
MEDMMNNLRHSKPKVEDWLEHMQQHVEPIWRRLGFPDAPDANTSGKGIGIIILDDIIPHELVHHLGKRLKQVKVGDDLVVTCLDVTSQNIKPINRGVEHGMMTLQLLSHLPLRIHNHTHVGLAPAANFIMLSEYEPEKIEVGLKWILERRENWNIQILLNLLVPNTREIGSMKLASQDPFVHAMQPAIQEELLIIAANGNTKAHNNLHPVEFFTVGGYDDRGVSDTQYHTPHPAVPCGINAEGFFRPDILAPFTYLPIPYCETYESNLVLSYFGGSCGAAALVTGVCANLLSKYPHLDHHKIRRLLHYNGELLNNVETSVPKVNAAKTFRHILEGDNLLEPNNLSTGDMRNSVAHAIELTELIEKGKVKRDTLWEYLNDESSMVRKTVISYGLGSSIDKEERSRYWEHLKKSKSETGEKISWLYQLLRNASVEELDQWMELLKEKDIELTLGVKIYLESNFRDAPEITYLPDPNPEVISMSTEPVWNWYREYKRNLIPE